MKDFDSSAAFFALAPESEAEVDRRMRPDIERIAPKKAEAAATRGAKELEQLEKAMAR